MVAGVLVSLVHSRLIKGRSSKTLRTGLHASVPVGERASVRRGLVALIDHGVLAMSGEDIGFTFKGRLLLAYVRRAHWQPRAVDEHVDQSLAEIDSILEGIDQDDRFDPQGPSKMSSRCQLGCKQHANLVGQSSRQDGLPLPAFSPSRPLMPLGTDLTFCARKDRPNSSVPIPATAPRRPARRAACTVGRRTDKRHGLLHAPV